MYGENNFPALFSYDDKEDADMCINNLWESLKYYLLV